MITIAVFPTGRTTDRLDSKGGRAFHEMLQSIVLFAELTKAVIVTMICVGDVN